MNRLYKKITDKNLRPVAEKIESGGRLGFEDGMLLEKSDDLLGLGAMANVVRERMNGNSAFYINNRHINHTNICVNECRFCAFRKDDGDEGAYAMALDEVMKNAHQYDGETFSEFHIVGGLHPDLPYDYYLDMIKNLHEDFPDVHLQAFTAVEIAYFAKISGRSNAEVLCQLKEAGLGSLPGGGAEIFHSDIRRKICPEKIDGDEWLDVHKTAHKAGIKSNATMLYGHIEKPEHRIDHLLQLRSMQDETGGFMTFIPLAFHPKNTHYDRLPFTTGLLDLRMIAISRLMLDNFDHIKAFWIMIGEAIAQVSLSFGADDMDGTVVEEKITHSAGAKTAQKLAVEKIERLIREAGREPVERDTLYNLVVV